METKETYPILSLARTGMRDRILEAIKNGATTPGEVVKELGITLNTFYKYNREFKFNVPSKSEQTRKRILETIEKGIKTKSGVIEKLDISYSHITRLIRKGEINLVDERRRNDSYLNGRVMIKQEDYPLFIRLSKRGLTLEELGKRFGVTKEGARKITNKIKVYDKKTNSIVLLKERRERSSKWYKDFYDVRSSSLNQERNNFLNLLSSRAYNIATEEDWPELYTLERHLNLGKKLSTEIPLEKVAKVLRFYKTTVEKGQTLTLKEFKEFTERIGFNHYQELLRIYNIVGLKALDSPERK